MKKYINLILPVFIAMFLFSCQEELEIEDAGSVILSGDWTVTELALDETPVYGPYELHIYNTSVGTDSIWVDNIYDSGYKVKAAKLSETTFAVTGAVDVTGGHAGTIDIMDGQVFNEDSISFRVILYDEAGEVADDYLEAGPRYSGF